jgi:hypothetical protein
MSEQYLDVPSAEPPRDGWGRPLVKPLNGGKPIAYTRCTTFVGVLEDQYNLMLWKQRQTARGLSLRPDLQLRVVSLGPQPDDTDEAAAKKWKKAMDGVCQQALDAAASDSAANIGTALHALTDRLDRGLDLGIVPAEYKPHLAAYEVATRNLTAVGIEQFVVLDDLKVGGTFDRLLMIDGHGDKRFIGDTKSGKNLAYGMQKIAMQLAVYAHAQLYDPATGARSSLGSIDLDRAVVIALNAKTGKCELLWVDIAIGWEDVQLAVQVRASRSRKGLSKPYESPQAVELLSVNAEAALEQAIRTAATRDELVQLWAAAAERWQPAHTELAALRTQQLSVA